MRVRVIPELGLPKTSLVASLNWIRQSECSGLKTSGTLLRSAFFLRKSSLRIRIWLLIWALEMFWRSFL